MLHRILPVFVALLWVTLVVISVVGVGAIETGTFCCIHPEYRQKSIQNW
jgi:hypothetical protein